MRYLVLAKSQGKNYKENFLIFLYHEIKSKVHCSKIYFLLLNFFMDN